MRKIKCSCACHKNPNIKHVAPCCDNGYIEMPDSYFEKSDMKNLAMPPQDNNRKESKNMKTENLNKENFWNELHEKYPLGMKVFCDWIDEYKKRVEWNNLFNNYAPASPDDGENMHMVKFHNIPLAMQIGIWIEFVCERGGCSWEIEDLFSHDWKEEITEYIKMLQAEVDLEIKLK